MAIQQQIKLVMASYQCHLEMGGVVPCVTPPTSLVAGDSLTAYLEYYTGSNSPTIQGNTANGPVTYLSATELLVW